MSVADFSDRRLDSSLPTRTSTPERGSVRPVGVPPLDLQGQGITGLLAYAGGPDGVPFGFFSAGANIPFVEGNIKGVKPHVLSRFFGTSVPTFSADVRDVLYQSSPPTAPHGGGKEKAPLGLHNNAYLKGRPRKSGTSERRRTGCEARIAVPSRSSPSSDDDFPLGSATHTVHISRPDEHLTTCPEISRQKDPPNRKTEYWHTPCGNAWTNVIPFTPSRG